MKHPAPRSMRLTLAALILAAACSLCHARPDQESAATPVTLTSNPAGALLTLDNKPAGTTPHATVLDPGSHLILLELPDYEPEFRTIEVGNTAVIENIRLRPVTSTVLVTSDPPGATVSRDGATVGLTPLLMPEVPVGNYRIDIALTGHKTQQQALTVSGSTPQRIHAELVSSSATLNVTASPAGAAVSVNGIFRGNTPVTVDKIPEGQSFIEVTADGHAPYQEQIQLAAGEVFAIHVPLQALPSSLTVRSIPDGARVYIDNQFKGETPLTLERLAAGSYRVRVEKAGHEAMARTIELGNNETLSEEFRLTANVGGVRIVTAPAQVSVFINGRAVGKTTSAADATDRLSEPLEITGIPIGETEIVFQRPGYTEEKRTVSITRNELAVVETVNLDRLFIPDVEVKTAVGTYTGVYINKDNEFYRVETSPGVIRAFPINDITRIRLIREGNLVEDLSE